MSEELEVKFKEAVKEAMEKIDKHLENAVSELHSACKIAEEYGVPFYANVSPLGQMYLPRSFDDKWGELDSDILEDCDIYRPEYEGWQHSRVC